MLKLYIFCDMYILHCKACWHECRMNTIMLVHDGISFCVGVILRNAKQNQTKYRYPHPSETSTTIFWLVVFLLQFIAVVLLENSIMIMK